MARQIVVGIDIGTSEVKVIVTEGLVEHGRVVPKVIGTGASESRGVSRGYINNSTEASRSVRVAVARAEKMSGIKIKRAYVSFGGIGLSSVIANGSVAISRADLEITDRDLALVLEAAEAAIPKAASINRKIINTVPIEYKIDGKPVWGQALGLKAQKLEVKALFITCLEHHLADLINAIEEVGIEVVDVVAAPVAASFVTLSKKQKRVGCLLADIGAETLSIVIFENGNLVSLEVFPVGGNDVTNDIALGLKIPLEDAENIKIHEEQRMQYPKKKLEEIISARLGECFDLVETHLESIGRDALLPAGIIMTGGGAAISDVKSIAESSLKLPAQVVEIYLDNIKDGKAEDRSWAVACGLSMVGLNADDERRSIGIRSGSSIVGSGRGLGKMILRWISQFLP